MRISRMLLIVLIGFFTISIGDSIVYAHRKYRINHNEPPRWVLQRHIHAPDGSIKYGTLSTNAKTSIFSKESEDYLNVLVG